MFKSAYLSKLFAPAVVPPVVALQPLQTVGSLFSVTASTPGVLIEHAFDDEYQFEKYETLAHFESQGLSLRLMVFPPDKEEPRNPKYPPASVYSRLVLADQQLGYRVLTSYASDEKPLDGLVTFAKVRHSLAYRDAIHILKEAASPLLSRAAESASKRGVPAPAVFAIAALVFISTVLFFSGAMDSGQVGEKRVSTMSAAPAPGLPTVMTAQAPVATSLGDQLNEVEKQILSKVVAESGIELASGGKPFVIFSDPNCPSCRQLEAQLTTLDRGLSPVIVPVSFQRNSTEAVSSVLCSTDIPGAWRAAVAADRGVAAQGGCAKGQAQADANNAAFSALKFDRTPTIVTSSGKVAVGIKDFDGLAKWIKSNS